MQTIESNMSVISACESGSSHAGHAAVLHRDTGFGAGTRIWPPSRCCSYITSLVTPVSAVPPPPLHAPLRGLRKYLVQVLVHKLVVCTSTWMYSDLERFFCELMRFRSSMSVNDLPVTCSKVQHSGLPLSGAGVHRSYSSGHRPICIWLCLMPTFVWHCSFHSPQTPNSN